MTLSGIRRLVLVATRGATYCWVPFRQGTTLWRIVTSSGGRGEPAGKVVWIQKFIGGRACMKKGVQKGVDDECNTAAVTRELARLPALAHLQRISFPKFRPVAASAVVGPDLCGPSSPASQLGSSETSSLREEDDGCPAHCSEWGLGLE